MKKIIIGIVIGLFIGLIGYFALTVFYSYEPISKDFASVVIKNESGQRVKKIFLKHNSGTFEASNLSDHGQVRFIFQNGGENSYNISVTFDNDSTLTSQEVYFEYSYRGTETITKSKIITKNNW
ncbi:MAG: hypothetical protein V4511_02575 [Bacteroidota bacterium]